MHKDMETKRIKGEPPRSQGKKARTKLVERTGGLSKVYQKTQEPRTKSASKVKIKNQT
jgi:hypothetical protein